MKTWLYVVLGTPLAALGATALVGACLPRDHVSTRAIRLRTPPAALFPTIRDFSSAPQWREGVKGVTLLPLRDGQVVYREDGPHGSVTYRMIEEKSPERLVVKIDDPTLPYGGTWTFELKPEGDGTEVRITEHGFVKNVVFRFLARFVFGHTASLDAYLRDLAKRTGE
jgi:uncharacterized protein YndB with AHSA1/START domain